jgi:hypothetical protein
MSNPECIRVRLEISKRVIDFDVPMEDFVLCLSGRAVTPAIDRREFVGL